jgi:hypothetical protein
MVDTISELSDLSHKLNQKSDSLNKTISTINKKLSDLGLGVEVWIGIEEGVPYFREGDEEEHDPIREETWLGYCKVGDQWELASKGVTVGTDEDGEQFSKVLKGDPARSLLQSPRSVRANAMQHVPRLLNAIKREAESLLKSVDEAEKTAEKL